jgi:hypothetical protein
MSEIIFTLDELYLDGEPEEAIRKIREAVELAKQDHRKWGPFKRFAISVISDEDVGVVLLCGIRDETLAELAEKARQTQAKELKQLAELQARYGRDAVP